MKILILSAAGEGRTLAHALAKEGHGVQLWAASPGSHRSLVGIVERLDSWRPFVAGSDLVICTSSGFSRYLPVFQQLGKPVVGCDLIADGMVNSCLQVQKVSAQLGFQTGVSKCYASLYEARSHEWESEGGYSVLSQNFSWDCHTPDEFRWALSHCDSSHKVLVREILKGMRVSTEGWWNGSGWLEPLNHSFLDTHAMPGDLGPTLDVQGGLVYNLRAMSRLAEQCLSPLAPVLKKSSYRGPVSVDAIVQNSTLLVNNIRCQFRDGAIDALVYGLKGSVAQFLQQLALGTATRLPVHSFDYLAVVRASARRELNCPVSGLGDMSGIVLSDIHLYQGNYMTAGDDGHVLNVTSYGRDVRETIRRCYARLERIRIPGLQYRNDIGKHAQRNMTTLREMGWLNG